MKIGILGDSHLKTDMLDRFIQAFQDVDFFIHTGDMYYDYEYLVQELPVPGIGVKGNCDIKGEEEIISTLGGKKFLVTHGHQYDVKSNAQKLFYRGLEAGADVVVFGHSHIPFLVKEKGLILINPGSIAYPRGGSQKSCAILWVEEEIRIEFKQFK